MFHQHLYQITTTIFFSWFPSTPPQQPQRSRGESIDLFLSQSPSQSLGAEFLTFKNNHNAPRLSPSTGSSTSRSTSPPPPATNLLPRTNHSYLRTSNHEPTTYHHARTTVTSNEPPLLRTPQLTQPPTLPPLPPQQQPQLQSQPLQQQQPQQQQQQQVFYMAVPTQDGRGHVLQPIQMVQLPGQVPTFVLPPTTNNNHNNDTTFAPTTTAYPSPVDQHRHHPNLARPHDTTTATSNSNSNNGSGMGRHHHGNGDGAAWMQHQQHQQHQQPPPQQQQQRPMLRDLLGQVRRLSRDQVGCRLLQQCLEEEGAASLILQEGLSFWGEAMVDPFGNYLFQKLLEKVSPEERLLLLQTVRHRLVNASLNLHGTRSVQKIVELCSVGKDFNAVRVLIKALAPAAARLCIDSHGNHVIQRILLKLPHAHSKFVFDAVASSVGDVARHRHGCCVIQRCLDSPPSPSRTHLVSCIVNKALELMQDAYGNYVVQYVLDVCCKDEEEEYYIQQICQKVIGRVVPLSIQKFSSNVMEKCLERCTEPIRQIYLDELTANEEKVKELLGDPFGNYVIQRALAVATHNQAIQLVEALRPHLTTQTTNSTTTTAGGRRILAKITRRFPHFSLHDNTNMDNTPNNSSNNNNNQHHQPLPIMYPPMDGR